MSDWSMYELEDIVWDVFGDSCDRVVPHPNTEKVNSVDDHGDSHKRARHDAGDFTVWNADNGGLRENNAIQKNDETVQCSLAEKKFQMLDCSVSRVQKNKMPAQYGPDQTVENTNLTSDDTGTSGSCFNGHDIGKSGGDFCSNDPIIESNRAEDESDLCNFSLDISPGHASLDFLANEPEDRENNDDLLDYKWPDVSNFEDVHKMFRTSYSAFGQGSNATTDDLSWFSSSSYAINDSEETYKSGFQSCSEMTALQSASGPCENSMIVLENNVTCMENDGLPMLDYESYAHWLDEGDQDKNKLGFKRQVNECSAMNESRAITFHKNDNGIANHSHERVNTQVNPKGHLSKSMHKSKGKKKGKLLEQNSGPCAVPCPVPLYEDRKGISSLVSASTAYLPSLIGHLTHSRPNSSSYAHSYNPYAEMKNSLHPEQSSITQSTSLNKSPKVTKTSLSIKIPAQVSQHGQHSLKRAPDPVTKSPTLTAARSIEEMHHGQKLHPCLIIGLQENRLGCQSAITTQCPAHRGLYSLENQEANYVQEEEIIRECPGLNSDSSSLRENLSTTFSDNMLLSPTSLRQLQDVMTQLDIRTKLCIRDGLYRLARNAEQRHGDSPRSSSRESMSQSKILGMDKSKRFPAYTDVETGTNAIDRSIAHLLFHRASEHSLSPAEDAVSLESRTPKMQNLTANHLVMPGQIVCQNKCDDCKN